MSFISGDVILGKLQIDRRARFGDKNELRFLLVGPDSIEFHILKKGIVISSRLEAIAFELLSNPIGGHVAALLSRAAPLKRIVGKIFDRGANFFWVDGVHRLLRRSRQAVVVLRHNQSDYG